MLGRDRMDVFHGSAEADTLDGGAEGDMLEGHGGADVLIGGTGNDTYLVDDPSDCLIEQKREGAGEVRVSQPEHGIGLAEALTRNRQRLSIR